MFQECRLPYWRQQGSAKGRPGGGFRIAYVIVEADIMVWLHAFKKKTQKTPTCNLEIAEKRMKEVLEL